MSASATRAKSAFDAAPGTHSVAALPVMTRLDGSELTVTAHVLRGAHDGPTVSLVGVLHGSQWFPIEAIRRIVASIDVRALRGTLIAVPVAHPMALERLSRMTPDESDAPDLNRVFPGGGRWPTEQIAEVISEEVLRRSDYMINWHTGPWGSGMETVDYISDVPDPELAKKTRALAAAFGFPSVRGLSVFTGAAYPGPRSIGAYCVAQLKVPNIAPNIGGSGFAPEVEEKWVTANLRGVRSVMAHVGMLDEPPAVPPRYFHSLARGYRVVPRTGGILQPVVGPEAMLTEVKAGALLARIQSPYTFETLEELRSPVDGLIFGVARRHPVVPGSWGYFVADTGLPANRWIDAARSPSETADRFAA